MPAGISTLNKIQVAGRHRVSPSVSLDKCWYWIVYYNISFAAICQ